MRIVSSMRGAGCVLFLLLFLFILNPYTKIGPLGYFLFPLLVLSFLDRLRLIGTDTLFILFFLIFLSFVGVFSSFVHGIGQFIHFKVAVSILVYVFSSYGIFLIARNGTINFNGVVYLCLLVIVLNSSIILIQVYWSAFRNFIESFLVLSGNINWTEGVRYRGLASGGGASLSVLNVVAVVLALHLYSEKVIGMLSLIVIVSLLVLSLFFIGRTGFLLLPIALGLFIMFNIRKYFIRVLFFLFSLVLLIFVFGDEVKAFVIEKYGIGFYNYSFGFFLEGFSGLKDEGTVAIIINFLKVMPVTFPEVLIGYGFYGGSDFYPWTDSGYSRMFLSIGYVFGLLFYIFFFVMFRRVIFREKYIFVTVGVILLVAEAKEPLLFSGYASRVYIFLLIFYMLEAKLDYLKGKFNKLNSIHDNCLSKAL